MPGWSALWASPMSTVNSHTAKILSATRRYREAERSYKGAVQLLSEQRAYYVPLPRTTLTSSSIFAAVPS